ncbi:PepSY-associated TM helix domain-containing protein [Caballeronia sp. HLA56]
MALFIAFYAGALTVFKEPIAQWVSPPHGAVHTVPLSEVPPLIQQTLAQRPAVAREFRIDLMEDGRFPGRMTWEERLPGLELDDHGRALSQQYMSTIADGKVHIIPIESSRLPQFLDDLHRVVGLPVDTNKTRVVMGVIAVLYALALVSGLIVLLPTIIKDLFALRLGHNLKRTWLDAHNVIGIVSLPFHLVIALTAVIFAFHDSIYALQDKMLHIGKLATSEREQPFDFKDTNYRDLRTMIPPNALLAKIAEVAPDFRPRTLQYNHVYSLHPSVRAWGSDAGSIMRSLSGGFIVLDPFSGEVKSTDYLPGHQSGMFTAVTSFFALHFGSFGGKVVAWLYFFLGLAGAFLFYTGNLLWVETRRKTQRRNGLVPVQKRRTRYMASATVGVCLGCVCGISATIVAGRWLYGHVVNLAAWHMGIYYATFFSSLALAFLRGPGNAAITLLQCAAALTALVPITSLIGLLLPTSRTPWTSASFPAIGVDLVAMGGAIAFAWMALATARRVRRGAADSVWASIARTLPKDHGAETEIPPN